MHGERLIMNGNEYPVLCYFFFTLWAVVDFFCDRSELESYAVRIKRWHSKSYIKKLKKSVSFGKRLVGLHWLKSIYTKKQYIIFAVVFILRFSLNTVALILYLSGIIRYELLYIIFMSKIFIDEWMHMAWYLKVTRKLKSKYWTPPKR